MPLCNETCPAPVTTINQVAQTIVFSDGGVHNVHQVVTPSGVSIALPNNDEPISGTFRIFKNGQLLTPNVDYTLSAFIVTLSIAAEASDTFLVDYMALDA